ncbi:MAG: F0F1 ATP synthase subunit epsilon [Phycisphaerales bacterium]|nr:F0F1 ATP synthase subunit epsilon [Phycisphaerales bacterium]
MSSSFRCAVMTPDGATFDGDVTYASFPAWDGQYGVMAGMAPLLDRLGIGPLRLDTTEGVRWFAVEEGFAHVRDNTLTILSESVHSAEDLSVASLQQDLRELDSTSDSEMSADEKTSRRSRLTSRLRLAETHTSGVRNA